MDWSPGADADRVTIELLIGGLEALVAQPTKAWPVQRPSRRRG
jgi:hypothetical protein